MYAYVFRFKYATVVSGEFKDFFLEYMAENEIPLENELKSDEFWDTVFYSTGLSAEFISSDFSNILADNALKLVMAITVFDLNKVCVLCVTLCSMYVCIVQYIHTYILSFCILCL